jgi:hypothetical protein
MLLERTAARRRFLKLLAASPLLVSSPVLERLNLFAMSGHNLDPFAVLGALE